MAFPSTTNHRAAANQVTRMDSQDSSSTVAPPAPASTRPVAASLLSRVAPGWIRLHPCISTSPAKNGPTAHLRNRRRPWRLQQDARALQRLAPKTHAISSPPAAHAGIEESSVICVRDRRKLSEKQRWKKLNLAHQEQCDAGRSAAPTVKSAARTACKCIPNSLRHPHAPPHCADRRIRDEYAPLKAAKQLRRGKRISEIEMLYGKTATDAALASQGEGEDRLLSPSARGMERIPELTRDFFESSFFRRFQIQSEC